MGNLDVMRDVFDCAVDVIDCPILFQSHDVVAAFDDTTTCADDGILKVGNFFIGIRFDAAEMILSGLEKVGDAFAGFLLNVGIRIDETETSYIAQ